MKEKIYTIPLNDAVNAQDECPFCFIERKLERDTLDFVLGNSSSYMESDVREDTDKAGFCRTHFQKMFDYGNTLGNAWILKTHYERKQKELQAIFKAHTHAKAGFKLFGKQPETTNGIIDWINKEKTSCYICDKIDYNMERYFHTFFALLKEPEFRQRVENSKGFCLHHFAQLLEMAEERLPNSQREWFYPTVFGLMEEHLIRVKEDLDWFVGMFDYRQQGADWKNSKDAVPRTMQKLRGSYPSDPPYKAEK